MAESVSAHANMAQVVEQLTRNEQVEGSSPSIGSLFFGSARVLVAWDGPIEGRAKPDERQRLLAIAERSPARALVAWDGPNAEV